MTIHWRMTPLAPFSGTTGTYQVFLRAMDMSGLRTTWQTAGTWTLEDVTVTATATPIPSATPTALPTATPDGNSAPTTGLFMPDGGSGTVGQPQTFTTTYLDADGWTDLRRVNFLMNASLQSGGLSAVYYQPTNRFYLSNDGGNGWVGFCSPGSAQMLNNSYVNLDCAASSVSGTADTLTVEWSITPLAPFSGSYGQYQVYLRALDLAGGQSGWVASGTWTLLE
jgi:hypothetical protein